MIRNSVVAVAHLLQPTPTELRTKNDMLQKNWNEAIQDGLITGTIAFAATSLAASAMRPNTAPQA